MRLTSSIQRAILDLTPVFWLELLCRKRPRFAIELLCYWINQVTVIHESGLERELVERQPAPLPVVKKMSKLSELSILNLLKQDESLWKYYMAGEGIKPLPSLPYLLLELMYDLGGSEGRVKVLKVVERSRKTLGGRKQGDILENFKTETVLDLFEQLPETEVRMRLMFSAPKAVALWLDHWDRRMTRSGKPPISPTWIGRLPAERAFEIEKLMRELEFRRPKIEIE